MLNENERETLKLALTHPSAEVRRGALEALAAATAAIKARVQASGQERAAKREEGAKLRELRESLAGCQESNRHLLARVNDLQESGPIAEREVLDAIALLVGEVRESSWHSDDCPAGEACEKRPCALVVAAAVLAKFREEQRIRRRTSDARAAQAAAEPPRPRCLPVGVDPMETSLGDERECANPMHHLCPWSGPEGSPAGSCTIDYDLRPVGCERGGNWPDFILGEDGKPMFDCNRCAELPCPECDETPPLGGCTKFRKASPEQLAARQRPGECDTCDDAACRAERDPSAGSNGGDCKGYKAPPAPVVNPCQREGCGHAESEHYDGTGCLVHVCEDPETFCDCLAYVPAKAPEARP